MRTAQVIGGQADHPTTRAQLQVLLENTGIQPINNEAGEALDTYTREVVALKETTQANIVICHSHSPLTLDMSIKLLYAMLKQRPIIISGRLSFAASIGFSTKTLIKSRLKYCYASSILDLDPEEQRFLISNIPETTDYHLSHTQTVLIRSHVRAYLHELFKELKQ